MKKAFIGETKQGFYGRYIIEQHNKNIDVYTPVFRAKSQVIRFLDLEAEKLGIEIYI